MQLVADVEDAAALAHQLLEHDEELFHRLRCQHRGRLVQNQQLGVGQKRADDLHALHLAHAQRVHRADRVDVQPVLAGFGDDTLRHGKQAQGLVQAQPNVLGHSQGVKQAEMLEHHADAQRTCLLRVADVDLLAVVSDGAFIGFD